MNRILLPCCLFVFHSPLLAVEIKVGTTRLSIPVPEGYAPVTNEMKPYADLAKRFVPPSNEQFALFLPEADVAVAARGDIPAPEKWLSIQTSKDLINTFITTADFAKLKSGIKTQSAKILKEAQAKTPELLRKATEGMDTNVSLDGMRPLPAHYETSRGFSYSAMVRYNTSDEQGKSSVIEGVVTSTFVHLQGKVLFLYAHADKDSVEWSQSQSQKWADSIIAANPSTEDIAAREGGSSQLGFDWNRVLKKALIGAIIGGIIGMILHISKKGRPKPT